MHVMMSGSFSYLFTNNDTNDKLQCSLSTFMCFKHFCRMQTCLTDAVVCQDILFCLLLYLLAYYYHFKKYYSNTIKSERCTKAHIKHAVGFVKHQIRNTREIGCFLLDKINQSTLTTTQHFT